jgi:hypothetical protein
LTDPGAIPTRVYFGVVIVGSAVVRRDVWAQKGDIHPAKKTILAVRP